MNMNRSTGGRELIERYQLMQRCSELHQLVNIYYTDETIVLELKNRKDVKIFYYPLSQDEEFEIRLSKPEKGVVNEVIRLLQQIDTIRLLKAMAVDSVQAEKVARRHYHECCALLSLRDNLVEYKIKVFVYYRNNACVIHSGNISKKRIAAARMDVNRLIGTSQVSSLAQRIRNFFSASKSSSK